MTRAPAWSEARHLGQALNMDVLAARVPPPSPADPLPRAAERWAAEVCVYCSGKTGLRVGSLAITGNVHFCPAHRAQFYEDKEWEGVEAL